MMMAALYHILRRPLVLSDFKRFEFYAKHVKSIRLTDSRIDAWVFRAFELAIRNLHRPHLLLENLHHIVWHTSEKTVVCDFVAWTQLDGAYYG